MEIFEKCMLLGIYSFLIVFAIIYTLYFVSFQNAPAEIFQGQGGITYYNAQSQAVVPRQTPPRRVKLAIPIVPPPEKAPRGRGRNRDPNSPPAQGQQELNTAASQVTFYRCTLYIISFIIGTSYSNKQINKFKNLIVMK